MNWLSLFKKNENITPDQVKDFISSASVEEYQILDVRQPKEYEQSHLPGAKLIPLGELPDRLDELDPEKKTIVY